MAKNRVQKMGQCDEYGHRIKWTRAEKKMAREMKSAGSSRVSLSHLIGVRLRGLENLCGINAAHNARKKPTRLRLGFRHDLGFSTLGNTLVANT